MALPIPADLIALLDAADRSVTAIDECFLVEQLQGALAKDRELTADERGGVFAEIDAWRFQRSKADGRRTWGIYWAELTSWSSHEGRNVYSPDVSFATEEVIAHWVKRSEEATHPTVRARFADLAWEIGRHNRVGPLTQDLARRAIDAYLQAVEGRLFADEIDAWLWLDRASELAETIRDEGRFLTARAAVFTLFRSLSAAGTATSLSHWRFDDIVWTYRFKPLSAAERTEVIDVLEQQLKHCADISTPATFDPNTATDMADRLQRWRRQTGEKDAARRALLVAGQAFEQASAKAGGILAVSWLEDLLVRYRNAGLHADAVRVEQAIRDRADDAEAEMTTTSIPWDVSAGEMERWADQVAGESPAEALRRLAAAGLLREQATRSGVEDMLKDAVLLSIMPITLSGPGGFTEAKVGSLAQDPDGRTLMHAGQLFHWQSPFLNAAFSRAREKHGLTTELIVAHIQACPFFARERLSLVHRGVEAWLADDFVTSIHILVPQVEAALRDCLVSLGGSVLRPNHNGGFYAITLSDVLTAPAFKEKFPADLRFHLRALYTDPRALNLRNHLAHGLMHASAFHRGNGNLVMQSVLLIALLRPSSSAEASTG